MNKACLRQFKVDEDFLNLEHEFDIDEKYVKGDYFENRLLLQSDVVFLSHAVYRKRTKFCFNNHKTSIQHAQ